MSLELARRLARALDVRNETAIRTIDQSLKAYVRLTPQSPTTAMPGTIDASQVVSGTFDDARIAESNVTQHEAALEIDTLQLSGTLADAQVAESNVTQHEAALSIAESQIPDGALLARVGSDETINGGWTFSGALSAKGIETLATGSAVHDYPLGADTNILEVTPSAPINMTGIAAPDGRLLVLLNLGSTHQIALIHNNTSSSGANRFFLPGNVNLAVPPRSGVILLHVLATVRWHVIGNANV